MKLNVIMKYQNEIADAYEQVKAGRFNKSIIENEEVRIVIYRCGVIIRIDIKEL